MSQNSTCKQCTKPFSSGEHSIGCEGFCCNTFHIECIKYSFADLLCYRNLTNVWWICEECRKIMKEIRSQRSTLETRTEENSGAPNVSMKFDQLDKELAALREQISEINQTLAEASSVHTTTDAVKIATPLAQSSVLSSSDLMCGTKNTDKPASISVDFSRPGGTYWLFFTRIKNSVTERDILKMIIDCLGTDDAIVRRLVPAWKDVSSMPFVSFKVGIGVQFREAAQRPSTWPVGLCFREFRENVWEPPQYNRSRRS